MAANKEAYLSTWDKIPRMQSNTEKGVGWSCVLVKNPDYIFLFDL